ncbi:uncharacterized protein LOC113329558 isoform X2 [Papaver somniferum]|uniref:uncharacterized protein LOC113329558 isoform X2 n=1 Tax=Papaver somniferum TaxID=3469 RepID=UPI000E703C1E|nr:uncharacterized protein LOC113329558 isoform X2 [Papaver somniferum]
MPNPLRKSTSSSKNSSSASEKGSSCLDNKNEEDDEKKRKKKKKLSAAKYRAILLKTQGKGEEDEKSDEKKKKKLIIRFKVGNNVLTQFGVKEEKVVAGDSNEVEQGGLNCTIGRSKSPNLGNVCVICKLGGSGIGMLLECSSKGCKKNYHLKCVDSPLKDVPPGDWHCACCEHSLPGAVESNLDALETELADSEGVDATKNNLCNKNDSNDGVEKLKEKPTRVVTSSKFVEYWVPVKLSNVQLEQYCNILLSNSALLYSCSKKDTVEALRDVLISTRKCCDHPYFVNPSLQKILTKGLSEAEYLKFGIKASGKLQVLDKILSVTKKQGLRVVIIFQSNVGSSGFTLGDVLDDVVHRRCGVDSYVRVDRGLIVSDEQFTKTKQTAMNRFNNKDTGRIVFLLDRRACHPSVKLSSVDIVILYDSDLNPYNDLKVLQKISIHSQHEQLKLFRLYSICTLEEMVLVNAKQNVTVDAQNLSRSTIHQMLRWGASYIFRQLVEFHRSSSSSGSIFSFKRLVKELFGPLPQEGGSPGTNSSSIVVKVSQTRGTYSSDASLPGELEMQSVDEELPHVFWEKLLNRTTPKWRYLPDASLSQRTRKRVQYFEGSLEETDFDYANVPKKRRTTVLPGASGTSGGVCSQFLPSPKVPTGAARFRKATTSSVPATFICESDEIPVQQELEGEIKESQQSCQTVLPLPSEPPKASSEIPEWAKVLEPVRKLPTNVGARIRECVHKALDKGPPEWAKKILQHCISREVYKGNASGPTKKAVVSVLTRVAYKVSHRKPVVVIKKKKLQNGSQSGNITSQQAEHPRQLPATDKHAELDSHDVVEPLEAILQLPIMSMDKSRSESGRCVSDSRSMGGVPDSINHPRQSAPVTSSRTSQSLLHHDPFLNESARIRKDQVGLVINSAPQPTYNDALQDAMHQQPMIIDTCVGGSVTRVSDFGSLGVIPDCVSHPLPIAPMTSSQTLPQDDPLLHELARLCQEGEQVVKFHEDLKTQIRSDFFREVQETNKKYSKLHLDNDTAFAQTMNTLHTYHNIFLMNEMLAKCFRDKTL